MSEFFRVRFSTGWQAVVLAAMAVGLSALPNVQASADTQPTERPRFLNVSIEPGARAALKLGKADIQRARSQPKSTRERGMSSDEVHAQKLAVVKAAKDAGAIGLTENQVDVFQVQDGALTVAVPQTITIDTIDVAVTDETLSITSTASSSSDSVITAGGPGMAPYWAENGSGQYVLTVKDSSDGRTLGKGTFLWRRMKLASDGSSTYDWFMYSRKAIGQPTAITGDYDPRVKLLRVQSYPYDSTESGTLNWTNIDPGASFTGDCSGQVYVEIETPIVSPGYNFRDCDSYTVWHNPENPGSYWIEMDQGAVVSHSGSMEAAYAIGWKAKNGTPGSMHDVNKILFTWHGVPWGPCTSTDSSKTCTI